MTCLKTISVLSFSLLIQWNSFCQDHHLKELYFDMTVGKNDFIVGKEYLSYYFRSNTTPLLLAGKEFQGTVIMSGRTFRGIKLQYDTYLDELVFTSRDTMINFQYPRIALNKEMIDSFILEDEMGVMVFVKPEFSAPEARVMRPGYYEIFEEGSCTLLIRHQSKSYRNQAVYEYRYAPEFFISTGNGFFRISSRSDIETCFRTYSHKIIDFIRSSGMNIRKADKPMLVRVIRYYNSLLNQGRE